MHLFFDRYLPVPLIKGQEHLRRLKKSTIAPIMSEELENIFSKVSQKAFFAALTTNRNSAVQL